MKDYGSRFSKREAKRVLHLARRRTPRKTETLNIAPHLHKGKIEYFSLLKLAKDGGIDGDIIEDIVIRKLYKWVVAKRVVITFCAIIGLFVLVCLPNSVKLYKKLDPIRQVFVKEALSGGYSIKVIDTSDGVHRLLDYGGRLDRILDDRDKVLRENCGILLGGWRAVMGTYSVLDAQVRSPVFCYNPFHKID